MPDLMSTQENLPPSPVPVSQVPPHRTSGTILALVFVLVAAVGYLIYDNYQLRQQLISAPTTTQSPQPSTTDLVSPTPESELLHYVSTQQKLSFDYPDSWKVVEESDAVVPSIVVSRGAYLIRMTFPDGYGPGVCIFSDHPDFAKETPEGPIEKCPGEYVSITAKIGEVRRRLASSEALAYATWSLSTRDSASGYFVTVPLMGYETPKNYDTAILKEMDSIIATLVFNAK